MYLGRVCLLLRLQEWACLLMTRIGGQEHTGSISDGESEASDTPFCFDFKLV
jgi:hypothetical protein